MKLVWTLVPSPDTTWTCRIIIKSRNGQSSQHSFMVWGFLESSSWTRCSFSFQLNDESATGKLNKIAIYCVVGDNRVLCQPKETAFRVEKQAKGGEALWYVNAKRFLFRTATWSSWLISARRKGSSGVASRCSAINENAASRFSCFLQTDELLFCISHGCMVGDQINRRRTARLREKSSRN